LSQLHKSFFKETIKPNTNENNVYRMNSSLVSIY
jgi:hypothetical protein